MTPAGEITQAVIELDALGTLISCLLHRGYCPVGPIRRDGSIVYDTLSRMEDLPSGWTDEQSPGSYRLRRADSPALFQFSGGPQSWKKFLHPPEIRLCQITRQADQVRILDGDIPPPKYAFIGIRPCELAAIERQDRVLLEDKFTDPIYQSRRQGLFIVAVNCTRSAPTCFCASLHTGPRAAAAFDLALTEICEPNCHVFLVETGSDAGAELLAELPHKDAPGSLIQRASDAIDKAGNQSRKLDDEGLRELLSDSTYHPHWDAIAAKCLSCANCTMVCPTCFCTTVDDSTSITGESAERWRRWDSCFSQNFSYIHGGSVRKSLKSRYRQWLTHKFSSWISQFGTSGCVGCGRCITWCPARIDITEEVRAFQERKIPDAALMEDEDGNA